MTVEEAIQAASSLLAQRGQLLNGHLLRLVEGDKEMFRVVREQLIFKGIAEDQSGVGLTPVEPSSNELPAPISQSPGDDWWLMKAGKIRGPLELEFLCAMGRKGEIEAADVVRHGDRGLWKQPDSVPEIAAARRGEELESSNSARRTAHSDHHSGSEQEAENAKEEFVFPEKSWSIKKQPRREFLTRPWRFFAACVGGSDRLLGLLVVAGCASGVYYWWELPPSNIEVYREFHACRNAILKLRERRAGRNDWSAMEEDHRPRVESIVRRLKPYANEKHPVEQALYLAGKLGLLPMLEYASDPTYSEQAFNKHIAASKMEK